jgi:hypothetical protein
MNPTLTAVLLLSTTFEAGCHENTLTRQIGTNVSASLVSFTDISQHENTVSLQADALNDLSQDLVRASMNLGGQNWYHSWLWIGISLSWKRQKCVGEAVTGDAAGALVGHHSGKKQIVRRVELINPNQLVRSIRKPNNTIKELAGSLPGLLAAQNKELEALSFDRGYGDNFSSAICKKLYRNSNKLHCIGRFPDTQRVSSELSQ